MIHKVSKCLILSIFFCLNPAIKGAERSVDLTFQMEPSSFHALKGEIRGQPEGGNSDSAAISGTLEATVVFDDETLLAKNITVTGGRIARGDIDISAEGTAFIPDVGNVDGTVRIRYRNLASTIRTLSSPGTILPSGQLIPSQHVSTVNEGTLTVTASAPGLGSQTQTRDFNEETGSQTLQGSGRLVITQQDVSPLQRTLLFRVTTANSYEDSLLIIDGSSALLDLTETIETSSTATVTIPVPPRVTLSPASRSIAAGGGNATFIVTSNTSWSWSDDADWLTSSEATTQDGNQAFSYLVAANTSTSPRSATITLTAGNITRTHTLTQEGDTDTSIFSLNVSASRLPSGAIERVTVSFPASITAVYSIEGSSDMRTWVTLEAGVNGRDNIIERSYPVVGAMRYHGFYRIRRE